MSDFQIESGVPVQPDWVRNTNRLRYPFAQMEVGESFHISVEGREEQAKTRARASVAANGFCRRWARQTGEKRAYIARVRTGQEAGEPSGEGVRVWRVR